jgi:hypothetical protein
MRVGHFFHYHPFGHLLFRAHGHDQGQPLSTPAEISPCIVQACKPSHSRGLDFFGLCRKTRCDDPRAELDRFSLKNCADERMDETWLSLL